MDWRVRSFTQLLALGCLLAATDCDAAEQRVVCYYTNWSVYRPGTAKFSPQNINPYLCTHLIYAFGGFTKENTLKPFDKYQDIEKGGYAKFTGLKTYNKNLKTMLAVGGWNEGSSRFSPMVADPDRRKEFVRNTVKFLRQNHFDGLDLDWEYPAFRDGGKPRDRDNYASLVQELREEYERESSKTGRPRLLLSMAVPAGIKYIDKGYDIPKLNKYLDFINLLSYDYHSSYEPAVNHHSPLYPLEEDNEYNFDTELTVDYTIKHLLESGASADKIVLGIPTYGRSYTLFNEEATELGSPADGPGEEGDATREKGYLAYYEICESLMDSDEWEIVTPNPNAMGPYAFKGNQWVGYDDEAIVKLKAQYVSENGLGGIMFWSIDNDDFRGKCHNRPYPLIEAAKEAMLTGSEKTSVGTKSSRPTKTRTNSNSIGRKLGAGRRTTTEASVIVRKNNARKRLNNSQRSRNRGKPQVNSEEEEPQVQFNGRSRGQFFDSEEDEDDSNNAKVNSNIVRSLEYGDDNAQKNSRTRSGNRLRNEQGRKRKPENSRRRSTTASSIPEPIEEEVSGRRITTPEPPTTPDPGTDFKCEDEGFFSHPRDCKKYFWCLDAGPGGLGIVAHHFTCPAGLVFNKAADSCDYPRNVVCPKTKTAEGPTTRAPIIAATSRTTVIQSTSRRSTTSTTPEPSEYSEEYEYYDDDDDVDDSAEDEDSNLRTTTTARTLKYKTISRNRPTTAASTTSTTTTTEAPTTTTTTQAPSKTVTFRNYQSIPSRSSSVSPVIPLDEAEEDPKVLKELIELIKKAGGIEELEKQIHLQGKSGESIGQTGSVTDSANSTPATISKSLYERVLNRQAANRGSSFFRRTTPSPVATTKESAEILDSQASITQRSRPSFRNGPGQAQFEGLDDIPEVKSLRKERPQYTTINRNRPSSTQPPDESDYELDEENENESAEVEKPTTSRAETTPSIQKDPPGYVNIRRSRPTTTRSDVVEEDEETVYTQRRRPATSDIESTDGDDEDPKNVETATEALVSRRRNQFSNQDATAGTTSRYITIQRVRSTTETAEVEEKEEEEEVKEEASPKEDVKVFEISSEPSIESVTTVKTPSEKIDDSVPVSETTVSIEVAAATEQTVLQTTTAPVNQPSLTTESSNFVPTDLPAQNFDPIATLLPAITVKTPEDYVTTNAAPSPSVVSIESTEEPNFDEEPVTKGSTTATVAQPRPFGFQRRTRPTTTSTTLTPTQETTTSTVSSDTGRVKVSSETVRLPTLKELIGYKTIVAHDYTTTTPITLSIKNLLDEDNDINNDESTKQLIATVTPAFESTELTQEQVQKTSTTAYEEINKKVGFIEENQRNEHPALETDGNDKKNSIGIEESRISKTSRKSATTTESSSLATLPIKILKQDEIPSRRRKIKLVDIPIRILESDKPLKDVILEIPEYKVDSVLKSLLRVEILNDKNVSTSISEKSKDTNSRNQRTRSRHRYRNREVLDEEKESGELLNRDANTNFILNKNSFTTTTPRISTVRGNRVLPELKSRGNRGFYVTRSIDSTTLYETITPTVPSSVTEPNNEPDERLSTIPEQLSTSNDNPSTIVTDSVTETAEFYTVGEESTSHDNWPSTITISLKNFNDVMAVNDDVDNPMLVAQKRIDTDAASTIYLPTIETTKNVDSTTESAFTEYEKGDYTSTSGEEKFALNSTEEYDGNYTENTQEPESSTEDSWTTSSGIKISANIEDLERYAKTDAPSPDLRETTTDGNENPVEESSTSGTEATNFNFYTQSSTTESQKTTVFNDETTSEAASTVDSDLLRTTSNWNTNTVAEITTSRSTPPRITTGFEAGTEASTVDIEKTTAFDFERISETEHTITSDVHRTTIYENTYPTAEGGAKAELTTEFNFYTETDTPEFQKTTVSNFEETNETSTTVTPGLLRTTIDQNTNPTAESSTSMNLNTDFNFYTEVSTPEFQKTTVSNFEETNETSTTLTPGLLRTTIDQNTNPTAESSTSTNLNTDFNIYTEVSTPELKKSTVSNFETTTEALETVTPDLLQTTSNQNVYPTTESSASTKVNTDFNFYTEISTPEVRKLTVPNFEITTEALEMVTPDLLQTTSDRNVYPTAEGSTLKSEATTSSTEFNFYTEVSAPDFQKTTASDFEVTNESTQFSDSETSTPESSDTASYTKNVDFTTAVNPSAETTSVGTTSDYRTSIVYDKLNSDLEQTTFSSDESLNDSRSVPRSETTEESTNTVTSSSSQADVGITMFPNLDSETTTIDLSALNSTSTTSDSITSTRIPPTTFVYKTEADTPIIETATFNQRESESTSNGFVETTVASTAARRDEAVGQKLDAENETKAQRPPAATRYSVSELARQSFYRSPSAVPGKKTWRRRVIKKRIYGVRSPHVETAARNENASYVAETKPIARFNVTNKPGKRFIRRRIINRTTGTFVDETVKGNPRRRVPQNRTLDDNINNNETPEFVQKKPNDLPKENNTVEKKLPKRRRVFYRRRPTNDQTNRKNSSIEANISSQNNSASNDVQSSSVSSTNLSERRRIALERFRYRGTGLAKRSTISPSSSPSPQSILVRSKNQLTPTRESTAEDNLPRRETGGQYLTDVTIDNLVGGSETYETEAVYGKGELPRTESISEAQPALMSEDDRADEGEINLFKTRPSSPRLPGTLLRQGRPSSSTSIPDNEIATTVSPSTKISNNVALRRRFRPGQKPATATGNVAATSQPASENGEILKSEGERPVSESLDQVVRAQEVEATVSARDTSSPTPPTVKGRPLFRTAIRRRISSTEAPQTTIATTVPTIVRQRQRPKPFEKVSVNAPTRKYHPPIIDYDYYEDSEERIVGKPKLSGKISIGSGGSIRCLDQGNFAHPTSCKKFITCARMVNGQVIGTEYTCPKRLSFDPVGGICNWSAGLGCKE